MKNNKLIVVSGMLCSDATAVMRGLRVVGVAPCDKLTPPREGDNAKESGEEVDLNAFNNELLRAIENDCPHPAPIEPADIEILRKNGYFLRAAELLRHNTSSITIVELNGPQATKLLSFWKEVFGHCQMTAGYVLILRHPLSAVKLLLKQEGFDEAKSYLPWLEHTLANLSATAGEQRILVDHDRLMQAPDHELERIAKGLNLEIDSAEPGSCKSEFVGLEPQHAVCDLNDLLLDKTCPPLICEIYTELLAVASDKAQIDTPVWQKKIEHWTDEFVRLKSSVGLVDKPHEKKPVAAQAMSERSEQIASLNQAVAERNRQIASLNQTVNEIRNSTSWRLTRPVRFMGAQWKRLRRIMQRASSAISQSGVVGGKPVFFRADADQTRNKIIVVTQDASPAGAQYLALNIARGLAQEFGFEVEIVCLGEGALKDQFAQYGRLHDLAGLEHRGSAAHALAEKFAAAGHRFAIVNTTIAGFFLETLKAHGIRCISLIHELPGVIAQHNLHEQARAIARLADKVVFPAQQVADEFQKIAPVSDIQRALRTQGFYKRNVVARERVAARHELRKVLHLPPDALVVLGVGHANHEKGINFFVEAGKVLVGRLPNTYLILLGDIQERVEQSLANDPQMKSHFIFPGHRDDTDLFYVGADVYALTLCEEAFPSVVLEAMDASLPVVGFEGVGSCAELLAAGCGKLTPAFDVDVFASALEEILVNRDLAIRMGSLGKSQVRERFSFRNYLFDLLKLLEYPLPRVSVVVPNYNYARFLPERIRTIEKQKLPVYELIVIDDCSSDDSVKVIENLIQDSALDIKFIHNAANSGSVFAQWGKGVELATGDLVWIAEADDLSAPDFLTEVLRGFERPEVVLSYSESRQIDLDGKVLCDNYLDYVADIGRKRWLEPYIRDGRNEIMDALSVKNTIPNVSAVVFRRNILGEVLKREQGQLREFKAAGDWYVYTKVLEHGWIAFTPRPVNLHRRHEGSVIHTSLNFSLLAEIVRVQRMVAEHYPVPKAAQKTARDFVQRSYEQFGLASSEFPNFEQALASAKK